VDKKGVACLSALVHADSLLLLTADINGATRAVAPLEQADVQCGREVDAEQRTGN
jgi:hypothetical protein